VDAQLVGFIEADIPFQAHGDYSSTDDSVQCTLDDNIICNRGYDAKAQVLDLINWAMGESRACPPDRIFKFSDILGMIPMSTPANNQPTLSSE
jgi:hypothetical protein